MEEVARSVEHAIRQSDQGIGVKNKIYLSNGMELVAVSGSYLEIPFLLGGLYLLSISLCLCIPLLFCVFLRGQCVSATSFGHGCTPRSSDSISRLRFPLTAPRLISEQRFAWNRYNAGAMWRAS